MPFSGHGTPIEIMNSQRLLLPVLGLAKSGCVTSQAWVCEGLVRPHPSPRRFWLLIKGEWELWPSVPEPLVRPPGFNREL